MTLGLSRRTGATPLAASNGIQVAAEIRAAHERLAALEAELERLAAGMQLLERWPRGRRTRPAACQVAPWVGPAFSSGGTSRRPGCAKR